MNTPPREVNVNMMYPRRRLDDDFDYGTIEMHEMLKSSVKHLTSSPRTHSLRRDQRRTIVTGTVFLYSFFAFNVLCTLGWLCLMYSGSSSNSSRVPPSWAPDMEPRYTFAMWQREVLLWAVANSDLESHRQAALVLQQLRGGASLPGTFQ